MQSNWRFTEPHLLRPVFCELQRINWRRSAELFRCWVTYRYVLAYVYALRGATEAVRSHLRLPVPLDQAAQTLKQRRQISLGHEDACPFLRSAPALGLGADDVAVLEGLAVTRQVVVLKEQWGYPIALPILAGLLDWSEERTWQVLRGVLGRWNLVELEKSGGLAFARMPEAAVRLFMADGKGCSPESHAEV